MSRRQHVPGKQAVPLPSAVAQPEPPRPPRGTSKWGVFQFSSFIYTIFCFPLYSFKVNISPCRVQRCWSPQRAGSPETPAEESTTWLWSRCSKTHRVSRTRRTFSTSSSKTSEMRQEPQLLPNSDCEEFTNLCACLCCCVCCCVCC